MSTDRSEAPWSDEEFAALIRRQNNPYLHEYTCPNGHGPLSVGRDGWECLACDYRQTWAHAADVLPESPRKKAEMSEPSTFNHAGSLVTVMPVDAPHFTLMNTQTEGERALREEVRKLNGELQRLTNILVGIATILEEHGIEIFDPIPTL